MKKEKNQKAIQQTMSDFSSLKESLVGNDMESAVRSLLKEELSNRLDEIIAEAEEDDNYEEEEVEDTPTSKEKGKGTDKESMEVESEPDEEDSDEEPIEEPDEESDEEPEDDAETSTEDGEEEDDADEWADFEEYKVGENEYDFGNADDEDIAKVFKLLAGDDEIAVSKDEEGLKVTDDETGSEYLITVDGDDDFDDYCDDNCCNGDCDDDECEILLDYEEDDDENKQPVEESFELVTEDEIDLGYTDDYQNKDVLTHLPNKEVSKSGRNWDKGVKYSDEKPWSGLKKEGVEYQLAEDEEFEECNRRHNPYRRNSKLQTEAASTISNAQTRKETKSPIHRRKEYLPKVTKNASIEGEYNDQVAESYKRKLDQIVKENAQMKKAIGLLKDKITEAAVTNVSLGQIVKLFVENTTTKAEKLDIIKRFNEGITSVKESNALYESIKRELKSAPKSAENFTSSLNESMQQAKTPKDNVIYESKELSNILDLMNRTMKR